MGDPLPVTPSGKPLAGTRPVACDEQLQARVLDCEPDGVEAALSLMERYDPDTLREALWLVGDGRPISAASFEMVAAAWDRYFHIRNLPWD